MINSIKFRMGSGLSIPIYSDWLKIKSLNIEENHLVISAVDGVPTDIAIAFEELPIGFIIFASQNIEFESVEQDLEHVYNAMEFDLYRRSMKIGFADLIQLHDLDNWRYLNGIPVELQLSMKVLEDDDGSIDMTISAKNDVANALMRQIKSVAGDDYSISVPDKVETRQAIANRANLGFDHGMTEHLPIHTVSQTLSDQKNNNVVLDGDVELNPAVGLLSTYQTGMRFENDAKLSRLVNLNNIDNGMIQVTGSDANLVSLARALQQINHSMGLSSSDEVNVNVGVSILHDESGEIGLVLRMPDDIEVAIPCYEITAPSSMSFYQDGDSSTIEYTLDPENTTDAVTITSSDTSIIQITDGVATAVGVGHAQIIITCGTQSATINVSANFNGRRSSMANKGLTADVWADGRYAVVITPTGSNVMEYAGSQISWGDGRVIADDQFGGSIGVPPLKIPQNCNYIRVNLTGDRTYAGSQFINYSFKVFFFDSTTEGKDVSSGESGYARWISTYTDVDVSSSSRSVLVPVDPNADSFAIMWIAKCASGEPLAQNAFTACTISMTHIDE